MIVQQININHRILLLLFTFVTILLFLVSCGEDEETINGCTNPLSLNYDPDATIDNNACEFSSVVFYTSQADRFQIDSRFEEHLLSFTIEINGRFEGEITEATDGADVLCTPSLEQTTFLFSETEFIDVKYTLTSEITTTRQRVVRSKEIRMQRPQEGCLAVDLLDEFNEVDEVTFFACNDPFSLSFNEEAALGAISCRYSKLIFYTPETEALDFGNGYLEDLEDFILTLEGETELLGRIEQPITTDLSDCQPLENTILYEFESGEEVVFVYQLRTINTDRGVRTGKITGLTFLPTQEDCRVINILDYVR